MHRYMQIFLNLNIRFIHSHEILCDIGFIGLKKRLVTEKLFSTIESLLKLSEKLEIFFMGTYIFFMHFCVCLF